MEKVPFGAIEKQVFRDVLQCSEMMVLLLDSEYRLKYWNDRTEELLGLLPDRDLGVPFYDLPLQWEAEQIRAIFHPAETRRFPFSFPDITLTIRDRGKMILGFTLDQLVTESPRIVYKLIGQDITRRRYQEFSQRMNEKLHALGELAGGIAHELNTPVQYVYNNLIYLKNNIPENKAMEPPLCHEFLEVLQESLEGMNQIRRLSGALKRFVHPGAESPEEMDLEEVIRGAVDISRNEWKYVADLEFHCPKSLPVMNGYPADLSRAIINLIVNAKQALEESAGGRRGRISITAGKRDDSVFIEVADDGPGVPEEIQDKIFEPFFTTKPRGIGSGQGLPLAYATVAEQFGGEIHYRPGEDGGSVFTILLPSGGGGG